MIENIREKLFWITDRLRGGKIHSNYIQIAKINSKPYSDESVKIQQNNLNSLLDHAVRKTNYYSHLEEFEGLNNFPIINKNIIKNNYSDFINRNVKLNKVSKVTTSGSTGTPFTVLQGKKKRLRHTADNIYFNELAGFSLGKKLYYLRIWNELVYRDWFKNYTQNIVPVEASKLDLKSIEESFLKSILRDRSEKALLAYASSYEAIINALNTKYKKPFDANVVSIISMSETLPEKIKEKLKFYFSCEAVSRYSNMENGFIGQQIKSGQGEYLINFASFYVEILKFHEDKPVSHGELGRIVITDLFNYTMPLIRYDTGDIASFDIKNESGIKLPIFKRIEGRKVDFISDSKGKLISPHTITNSMWKFPEINQFQFIQNGQNDYKIILNTKNEHAVKDNEVLNELKKYVGEDAEILVEHVNEIPLLSSGKRKKVVNNFKKYN